MKLQDSKRLINSVIGNEFRHIQETQSHEELKANVQIELESIVANSILKKLLEIAPEHKDLLNKLDNEVSTYWADVCEYYFKKGVIAGTTNLNFLRDTDIMEYI